jgi:hypothetical protein
LKQNQIRIYNKRNNLTKQIQTDMAITTLSSPIIAQRKQETLNAQSIRKTVAFRDINLVDDKTIEYQGKRIGITNGCFKSLLKLIGMSNQFAANFESLFNAEAKATFINRIKDAMASNSGRLSEVTLVLSPYNKTIIGITKKPTDLISNDQFLNVAERIIDQSNFDVTNWSVDPTSGIIQINAFNPKATFGVQGLNDEVFTGGVTFRNSPLQGFQVLPYVNRLWCSNGMTTSLAEESYTLNSLDNKTMETFFQQLSDLRKNNYAPTAFADKVRIANSTPASISEMRTAYNQIDKLVEGQAERWVPLNENLSRYAKAGFENLNADQMKAAKSNTSVWDVVNGLTHFATHAPEVITSNVQEYDQTRLMIQAGNIFGKTRFDHENSMPNPFGSAELVRHGSLLN